MKITKKQNLIFLIFGLLICLPRKANADALEGMGAAFEFFLKLVVSYCFIGFISLLLAVYNIKKKKKGIRIFNWIVLAILAPVAGILPGSFDTGLVIILMVWVILQVWIISKSYPRAEEESEKNI
jgi:predicted acyltransferase